MKIIPEYIKDPQLTVRNYFGGFATGLGGMASIFIGMDKIGEGAIRTSFGIGGIAVGVYTMALNQLWIQQVKDKVRNGEEFFVEKEK